MIAASMLFAGILMADDGPNAISNEDAKREAYANRLLATQLRQDSEEACYKRDIPALYRIMSRIGKELSAQPTNHLKYRARFKFSGCSSLLGDVSGINGDCVTGLPGRHSIEHFEKRWAEDTAQCDRELSDPNWNHDEPEPKTEEELAAKLRREGTSEEDIGFIMKLRNL
ncbi:hypothetical protein [Pseudomonas aeruginosa]|uniref:hypothetical protein n=1 Tax=Pseudomonas aeruginosa TaxID=287 RepID=UPI000F523A43|nr:hypothetical protein [Pseudomonas aeruginosa]EIU2598522.1 hypothetical protein [Pseudomonas aeruginosa]EIU2879822.1 hypothetical protein [Pseudomonas aeruginosa]ELC7283639.1 hypothetical protein [Pseudomonas aeruginosa]ELK4865863.1 hypothetical protein [Pseudomonas aeruginosa]ELN9531496.1 hypothetical protein [Pseudomonas aeruginosa]